MVGATVICNIIAYVCDLLLMHTTMCTYIEPTISQVLSQLCDINFLSSYPPSIVHCQVCEGLPAGSLPRLLILLLIILLFFSRFFSRFQPLLYLHLVIFVTPDATSTKVAYPVLCEIRRKRVRATRGEITEEQREVKTRLERERREEGTEG